MTKPVSLAAIAAAALLSLTSTGCFWKKRPPAPPAVPPPQTKPVTPTLKPAPPPPKIEPKVPETVPQVSVKIPEAPKPPQAKPAVKRPRKPATVAAKPAAGPQTTPPAPEGTQPEAVTSPPKLGDLLTDAQRADLLKKCDTAMQSASAQLDRLASKTLPADAQESVGRVRVFLQQAEQAKARDPQTALQLAQRADVLAKDLLKTIR